MKAIVLVELQLLRFITERMHNLLCTSSFYMQIQFAGAGGEGEVHSLSDPLWVPPPVTVKLPLSQKAFHSVLWSMQKRLLVAMEYFCCNTSIRHWENTSERKS